MSADTFKLDVVAEALATTVSRHATARACDNAEWLDIGADLHPADSRDAARDLLDLLAARGIGLRKEVAGDTSGLGGRLLRLGVALAAASSNPGRVQAIAGALVDLAAEARDRDDAVVPAHLRMVPGALPAGVVALDQRRCA
jgi:hypothetical protein